MRRSCWPGMSRRVSRRPKGGFPRLLHRYQFCILFCKHPVAGEIAMSAMVRVTDETHAALRDLSRELDEPMQEVLARAVEEYRRHRILELSNQAYAALRADPIAWQEIQEERVAWDSTLLDGLEGDEWPAEHTGADE